MKFIYKLFFSLVFFTSNFTVHIKVLLEELSDDFNINVVCPSGLRIKSFSSPTKSSVLSSDLILALRHGVLLINGKKLSSDKEIIIEPVDGSRIKIGESSYDGSLVLRLYKNKYYLINRLNLEDYVCSVLRTESWPGWPLEMHKVMAIASRSYALARILESRKANLPYHIKPSNYHQTYTGAHNDNNLKKAVQDTSGVILVHNKKPVLAMFDICCGGIVPANIKDMSYAPLKRKHKCEFCKEYKVFNWTFEVGEPELLQSVQKHLEYVKSISEFKIHSYDKAGLVEKILIRDGRKVYYINGKKAYSLFKEIKSYCFEVVHFKRDKKVVFKGKGFGHHVGLCQWGAYQMTKEGYNCKDILRFFYHDVDFMKVS